jgi:hypothetical protein
VESTAGYDARVIRSGVSMKNSIAVFKGTFLAGLVVLASACVVAPREGYREGYYDRDHHRYYHENTWHDCTERDEHCR